MTYFLLLQYTHSLHLVHDLGADCEVNIQSSVPETQSGLSRLILTCDKADDLR